MPVIMRWRLIVHAEVCVSVLVWIYLARIDITNRVLYGVG